VKYRASRLEEIVGDLMEVIDREKEASQRHRSEASRAASENRHLRAVLCDILAATQTNAMSDEAQRMLSGIESMVEEALGTTVLHQSERP
jgi:hypothetical protein